MAKKRNISPLKDKRLLWVLAASFGLVLAFFGLAAIARF
jgi:hypothetical protein